MLIILDKVIGTQRQQLHTMTIISEIYYLNLELRMLRTALPENCKYKSRLGWHIQT